MDWVGLAETSEPSSAAKVTPFGLFIVPALLPKLRRRRLAAATTGRGSGDYGFVEWVAALGEFVGWGTAEESHGSWNDGDGARTAGSEHWDLKAERKGAGEMDGMRERSKGMSSNFLLFDFSCANT